MRIERRLVRKGRRPTWKREGVHISVAMDHEATDTYLSSMTAKALLQEIKRLVRSKFTGTARPR